MKHLREKIDSMITKGFEEPHGKPHGLAKGKLKYGGKTGALEENVEAKFKSSENNEVLGCEQHENGSGAKDGIREAILALADEKL
ncbi:hypothetical protein BpHYR1_028916 [Brachionus plicatilis]|uniref:Uncharacterized protein n=1 Tax=Brachionus plicatilis TaxID=10195 RepID=A0A3M7PSI1_BRAPC|nr:hypothetical protein BpHYR1_028916 [Brachionus plicatilis]